MSVLVFADSADGKVKKSAFELVSYGNKIAEQLQTDLRVVTINNKDASDLYTYGAVKVINVVCSDFTEFNAKGYAAAIAAVAKNVDANVVVIDSGADGLYLAPLVSVEMDAAYVSNVVSDLISTDPFVVKRKAFSNKAFSNTEVKTANKVIGLAKNSFGMVENPVEGTVENYDFSVVGGLGVTTDKVERATGQVTIADADVVVSAGRGLKGPENWGMVEELADVLGAATACSKPVSDLGWRPHSEHVGQTGKPVATNLYIAIGISGAIQHLAGVNASKVKVVINTDPEAPFFKAADYGIVGDAFEVVPKLIDKLKAFKQA